MTANEYYKDDSLKSIIQIIEIQDYNVRCKLIQGKGVSFPPGTEIIISKSVVDLCMQKCAEDFRYKPSPQG